MPQFFHFVVALAATQQGGGWLFSSSNTTNSSREVPGEDIPKWAQLWAWMDEKVPILSGVREGWTAALGGLASQPGPRKAVSWDSGLCMALDAVISFVGWMLFGNAWPGVKTGCQRIFRLATLILICLCAHYLWALCWPVISVGSALLMGLVWFVRAIIRKLGTLVYWAQRAAGGVPEAADAEFLGPGTGRIPETADLRSFKKTGTADKWVLLKREGKVAVFKVGTDTQTIKTAGLYVPVEADTMRGDQELVDTCRGHDRVHLCRSLTCAEDGQHFKEYGIALDFDPEKFHLKNAELGAAKAGRTLWAWLWSSPPKKRAPLKEYASQSETEPEKPCEARRVVWVDKEGTTSWRPDLARGGPRFRAPSSWRTSTTRVASFRCVPSMRWTMRGIVGHMVVNTQAVTGLASWTRTASGAVDFMEADEDLPLGGGLLPQRFQKPLNPGTALN